MAATQVVLSDKVVEVTSPQQLATFANTLKAFVVENELFTQIKGKNFVHVEGWQFAGACMGIFARPVKVENIGTKDGEWKYRAEIELYNVVSDKVVGGGVAIASKSEDKKKSFDEYAIASMAQTRATSKAFRLSFGWIMKIAGYEATPAEEVTEEYFADEVVEEVAVPIEEVKKAVIDHIDTLSPTDKVRFVKDNIKKMNLTNVSDEQYRRLYNVINLEVK